MKLKLQFITVFRNDGTFMDYSEFDIIEHDELHNGVLIKTKDGRVHKYINVGYLVVREPA